jgi:hypothetical protein
LISEVSKRILRSLAAAKGSIWLALVGILWLASATGGLWVLWAYDNKPGIAANPSARWPATSRLAPAADGPTLVLFAHPQCSCSPASLGELAEVLARADKRPRTYVVFLKPSSVVDGWERTALWQQAARLENVTVIRDDDGLEAQRFSAATSGQTFLYDSRGVLQFSGGITSARGHAGDNAGRAALISLVNRLETSHPRTNVFGCPLFASAN